MHNLSSCSLLFPSLLLARALLSATFDVKEKEKEKEGRKIMSENGRGKENSITSLSLFLSGSDLRSEQFIEVALLLCQKPIFPFGPYLLNWIGLGGRKKEESEKREWES